jgi:nitrite reductase/ring-hydroxylating ferredoxin subunit
MAQFTTVAKVGEIGEGEGRAFQVQGKLIAVFLHQGQYYAIDDTCPHMGAPLSEGHVADGVVTCSWHAWRFRLCDGTWADSPKLKIGCYRVRVQGEEIQVEV